METNSHHWLVWSTDETVKATVWPSQGIGAPYWTKVYTSPDVGEKVGAVQLEGGLAASRQMIADLAMSQGGGGRRDEREIALFRVRTWPPG